MDFGVPCGAVGRAVDAQVESLLLDNFRNREGNQENSVGGAADVHRGPIAFGGDSRIGGDQNSFGD